MPKRVLLAMFTNRARYSPIFFCITLFFFSILQADGVPSGATPLADRGLKITGIETRGQLQEKEAQNIHCAIVQYFSEKRDPKGWFQEKELKAIHRAMFDGVWSWAGSYYDGPPRNIGMSPALIPFEMQALCEQIRGWREGKTSLSPLEQSVRIAHRLVQIHPFYNGNGRFARFVANLYLFSLEGRVIHWPEMALQNRSPERQEYVQALKRADKGDYDRLEELFLKYELTE